MSTDSLLLDPEKAIDAIADAAEHVAEKVEALWLAREESNEMERSFVAAMIGQANPLTNKPHSATSAAEAWKSTEDSARHSRRIIVCETEAIIARAEYDRNKLRAKLAVGLAVKEG